MARMVDVSGGKRAGEGRRRHSSRAFGPFLRFLGDEAQGGDKTPYGVFARVGFLRRVFGLELLAHARPNLDGQWSRQH